MAHNEEEAATKTSAEPNSYLTLLYYSYTTLAEPKEHCAWQQSQCEELGLRGRIRVSKEGLNGTVSGPVHAIHEYQTRVDGLNLFKGMQWKTSSCASHAFPTLRVNVRPTVVDLAADVEVSACGRHLGPTEFHDALTNIDWKTTILLDARNVYETRIGRFDGALGGDIRKFSDLPRALDKIDFSGKKVLMYCTGGVRCESASAYLMKRGVADVAQLHGGIHEYLRVYEDGGHFSGRNFVFDERVALPAVSLKRITGKCCGCGVPTDDYPSKIRCRQCRLLLLVCEQCEGRQDLPCELCTPESKSFGVNMCSTSESTVAGPLTGGSL